MDLRYSIRQLAKSPGFTAVAVLSLALGIGAATTVFSWIQAILLHPLPGVYRPQQMVVLTTMHADQMWDTVSLPDIRDYARQKDIFAGVIGSQVTPACVTIGRQSTWIYGQVATANFFDVLGVKPLLGRTFLPNEDRKPGGNPVLVLGERCWRRLFHADPAVIGRTVELNRHVFNIIGIVPAAFHGTMSGLVCDFWAPVSMTHEVANFGTLDNRSDRWLHTQARLQPGFSIARAQAVVDTIGARLEKAYPETNRQIRLRVLDFIHAPYGAAPIFARVLGILLAVSIGVLLIVAANIAALLLARGSDRSRELALRLALGASRVRLVRQLLTESLVLSLLGGGLGVLLASWGTDLLSAWTPPTPLPVGLGAHINAATLGFALAGTVVMAVLFGLVPALRASKPDLHAVLKEGARGTTGGTKRERLRALFVVAEIAVSLVLLVGAGLCIKNTRRTYEVRLGFDPSHVLLAGLRIGMNGYTEATGKVFYGRLQQRLANMPGVESAALASWFPLGFEGGPSLPVDVPGYTRQVGEDTSVPFSIVSPGYFRTLKIAVVAGRDFSDHDDEKGLAVAVVNQTMARRFWRNQDPVGRKFHAGGRDLTVIGVAENGKYRSLSESPRPFFYMVYRQGVWDLNLGVCVRTIGDPDRIAPMLEREIRRLDPRVQVWTTLPMSDYIKAAYAAPVLASRLLTWLGFLALALAAMGVYGIVAYSVSQRTQEFGVRIALGAQAGDVVRLVLRDVIRIAIVGIGIGVAAAFAVTRLLTGFLQGVRPDDPATFTAVPLLLAVVALVASWLPARRATRVDPVTALRSE